MKRTSKKPTKRQQLAYLMAQIAKRKKAFNACRGKFGVPLPVMIMKGISPGAGTSISKRWLAIQENFGDEIVGLMMELIRKKFSYALGELQAALTNPQHLFPGEAVELSETRPVTAVMTMVHMKMAFIAGHLLQPVKEFACLVERKEDVNSTSIRYKTAEQIAKLYPEILTSFESYLKTAGGLTDYQRASDHVLEGLDRMYQTFKEKLVRQYNEYDKPWRSWSGLKITSGQNFLVFIDRHPFVFCREGVEMRSIRKEIPSPRLDIGVWQLNLPKAITQYKIAIHPASMHRRFQALWPSLTSVNTSRGFGCCALVENPLQVSGHPYPVVRLNRANQPFGVVFG